MTYKNIISFILILICLNSCAQKNDNNLKIKSIYQVTEEDINQTMEKYGLIGKVKNVEQKTYYVKNDSITDFSKYQLFDLNEERDFPNLAEMDNDCKVTFNKKGKIEYRISFGNRFGSESTETDTFIYDAGKKLIIIRSKLEGDDFSFPGDTKFEYNNDGHLIKQSYHKQLWSYTYYNDKNQVRISSTEDNEFRYNDISTYNKFGQRIESLIYEEDGSLAYRNTYEYDDSGAVKKETRHDNDGSTNESLKHKYDNNFKLYKQFDKNNNCTTEIIVDLKGKTNIRIRKFEYYE